MSPDGGQDDRGAPAVSPGAFEPDEGARQRARSAMRAADVARGSSLAPMDTSLDHDDEHFFAQGHAAHRGDAGVSAAFPARPDPDATGELHARILARARTRRRELAPYVIASVGVCLAVGVAALVRAGIVATADETPGATTAAASPSEATQAAALPAPTTTDPPPDATQERRAGIPATTTPPSPASAHARSAREEKEGARRLLGQGKAKEAIALAERAVALDPSDADGWLVLGAAHQELHHTGSARASFRACVKEAKKGPVAECRAMLR